jgi:hypothetical protein
MVVGKAFSILICVVPLCAGHFLFLKEDKQDGHRKAVVTFGEKAGVPGAGFFLEMVSPMTHVYVQRANGKPEKELPLAEELNDDKTGQLVSDTWNSGKPVYLGLECDFGAFNEDPAKPVSRLKYYSTASVVSKPNDWMLLQDFDVANKGFEITIRDPYMAGPKEDVSVDVRKGLEVGEDAPPNPDQCKPGAAEEDDAACVVVVVRYKGRNHAKDMNVSIWNSEGEKLQTVFVPKQYYGVFIAKIPKPSEPTGRKFFTAYASVQYVEPESGTTDNGEKYENVDHWATTHARIYRTKRNGYKRLYTVLPQLSTTDGSTFWSVLSIGGIGCLLFLLGAFVLGRRIQNRVVQVPQDELLSLSVE